MPTESTALKASADVEVWGKAQWEKAFATRYLPDGMSIDQAKLIAASGRELGLGRFRAIRGLVVIKNRITMSAELMNSLMRERAHMKLKTIEASAERCCVSVTRRVFDTWDEWNEVEFTKDDAIAAGLWGRGTWAKYPKDMLWARCISRVGRRIFPDVIQGMSTPEEIRSLVEVVAEAPTKLDALLDSQDPKFLAPVKSDALPAFQPVATGVDPPPLADVETTPDECNMGDVEPGEGE